MNGTEKVNNHKKTSRRIVVSTYSMVGSLTVAIVVLALLLTFVFRIIGVKGNSMQPTLHNGDMLLMSTSESVYRRGDVVIIDRYTENPLIKRVIAVGGDTISISESGVVSVNGKPLKESYIQGVTEQNGFCEEVTVPRGYLFVMGDNRMPNASKDSRSSEVGFVSVSDVVGKAEYCVWPPKSFGKV